MKVLIWLIHKEKNINRICKSFDLTRTNEFEFYSRARRAARENQQSSDIVQPIKPHYEVRKFIKIGRPGYKGKSIKIFLDLSYSFLFFQ
jgi:hypothetical protein